MVSSPTRILVADDEAVVLTVFDRILSHSDVADTVETGAFSLASTSSDEGASSEQLVTGYDLILCRSAEEAVEAMRAAVEDQRPPAVAFLDEQMPPGPDGVWAAEQIRALDSHVEIVIITPEDGPSASDISRRVPPPGKLMCLRKPLHPGEIRNLANALASKWQSEQRLGDAYRELKAKLAELRALNRDLRIQSEVRRRAEHAMIKSESLYRTLAESARDYILVVNSDERLDYINPFCERLFEKPVGMLVGAQLKSILPPKAEARMRVELHRVLETEEPNHFEHAIHFDGRTVWLDTQLIPVQRELTNLRSALWIARDVTERKLAEEQYAELERHLFRSQKLEAIGRLAGGVAHDFNNMLTVILNYTQFISDSLPTSDAAQSDLHEIRKAAERAAQLTDQLLAFSWRGTGEPEIVNANAVIANVAKATRRLIGDDIELVTTYGDTLHVVRIDPAQLQQAIMNLVVNARDAMPSGGRLVIETANSRVDTEMARTNLDLLSGHYVTLTVSDTGTGISPQVMEHLFEPFYTTKEKGKGTGLGLAMVYGIVKQAKGHILVSSTLGEGTTFRIFLPKAGESSDWPAADEQEAAASRDVGVVLVVEDEMSVLRLTRRILEDAGFEVIAARSAMEAEQLVGAHSGRIDLLLTDVVMPTVNGRELAERIRAGRPDIRVIFMSGHSAAVIGDAGVIEPNFAFIQKPFSPSDLVATMREVLGTSAD